MIRPSTPSLPRGVAIIGMAGRFPNAPTLDRFWAQLRAGVECISRFSDGELAADGVAQELRHHPRYVPARGVIEGRELFDAAFFGVSPREAELTDPQQRLLLECAWEAFENAGYDPERPSGAVGVFAGVAMNTYFIERILRAPAVGHSAAYYQAFIGNDKDFCATRLSYKLGLRGPSVNVQTACSTSLVAVHLAAQALLTYQCDMALAGAASIEASHAHGYLYEEGMILSPDGRCRPFDAAAGGTVGGEGVAVVVLKRLADALADRDAIRAVILGSGINNDGSLKAGFTAPSVDGQHEAIVLAHSLAGIDPATIGYVEGHGTATPLGDPIEVTALSRAFREHTSRRGFCALGSVKSNIGHTDTVAGLAGLTKTVLAIEHGEIPPTLHFAAPNPALDLEASPFFINTTTIPWPEQGTPRRAGVSSFGIGGTNAHLVLEQAPSREPRPSSGRCQILTLSARTSQALDRMSDALVAHLSAHSDLDIADAAFTLQQGRRRFEIRRTVLCRSREECIAALTDRDPRRVHDATADGRAPAVAFMFSGQGSQYPGMGAGLYATEPAFREAIDRCSETVSPLLGRDLREVLFAADPMNAEVKTLLTTTAWAQPSLFIVDYALAQLWIARGLEPDAMIGHSLGEYVAATMAGVLQLEDALRLVAARGRLMQAMPAGAMTVVPLTEPECREYLSGDVALAAINAPNLLVASGPSPAIEELEARLAARLVSCRRLHTSHAFHSSMMDLVLEPFRAELSRITLSSPTRRYVSNLTGRWITAEQATSPEYWLQHLRQPVRFAEGIATLCEESSRVLLETGPGTALASLARLQPGAKAICITSLRHPDETVADDEVLAAATGHLWRAGAAIDWSAVHVTEPRSRVALPSYPFERQRFWIDTVETTRSSVAATAPDDHDPAKRVDIGSWFYLPSWTRSVAAPRRAHAAAEARRKTCLVFRDRESIAQPLIEQLGRSGHRVISVRPGSHFLSEGADAYVVRAGAPDDCAAVLARVREEGAEVDAIVHLWGIGTASTENDSTRAEQTVRRTYDSLVAIAQGLGRHASDRPCRVVVVTTGMHDLVAGDAVLPEASLAFGPSIVMPLELPGVTCTSIDIDPASSRASDEQWIAEELIAELDREGDALAVAYRQGRRWVRCFEPAALETPTAGELPLKDGGVYLFTGGFGGMALVLADMLASSVKPRIALVGRSAVPPLAQIAALEAKGAEVMVVHADVSNTDQMRTAIQTVRTRFGPIDGVIHAAGVAGGGLMLDPDGAAARSALAAKVEGTRVLVDVLDGARPAWIVLCSSINAVFPSPGAADYCAANAFLDAFATAHDDPAGTRVISIGWDTWQEVGMAVGLRVPRHLEAAKRDNLRHGMTNAEGQEVFRRILASPTPHVLVLTQGYDAQRLRGPKTAPRVDDLAASSSSVGVVVEHRVAPASAHARPAVSTDYMAPEGETEEQIAKMWESLLGIEPVGRHDNFFELGGHSLLATQLTSRIRDRFGIQLPLRTIFDANTVVELARHVTGVLWAVEAPALAGQGTREEIDL